MKRICSVIAGLLMLMLMDTAAPARAATAPDPHRLVGCYISMGYWNLAYASEQFTELSNNGVNFVIDYALVWPEDPAEQDLFNSYLAIAGREQISVGYCLFNALEGATPRASSRQIEHALHDVEELRERPQIGAWYVHDEVLPDLSGVDGTEKYSLSLQQMRDLYQRIRSLDSSRPQICVWNQLPDCAEMNRRFKQKDFPHGMPDWLEQEDEFESAMCRMVQDCCDWVMVDCYPVGAPWLSDNQSITAITTEVSSLVRRAATLRRPGQPLLLVYQSFDWKMYGKSGAGTGFPSLEQMRSMLQAGFAAGADNALAYSWFDLTRKIDGKHPAGQARCQQDLCLIFSELAARH